MKNLYHVEIEHNDPARPGWTWVQIQANTESEANQRTFQVFPEVTKIISIKKCEY